jgi:hypothetical protein
MRRLTRRPRPIRRRQKKSLRNSMAYLSPWIKPVPTLKKTGCGLSGYLDLYRTHGRELIRLRGALSSDHPAPVATTWALSFEKIEKANLAAVELLRFCAFLHPDGIPEEFFSKGALELGPVLGPLGSDAFELNRSISEILKYSLLRRDPKAGTLEIHRLVQAVLKQEMGEATQRRWAERAVRAVGRAFPVSSFLIGRFATGFYRMHAFARNSVINGESNSLRPPGC